MITCRRFVLWVLFLILTAGADPARAAECVLDGAQMKMLEEGVALRGQNRDADALVRFESVYSATRCARALAQVALAEKALGRWWQAERDLREALASKEPWIERIRATLRDNLSQCERKLGSLEILVEGAVPAGAEVLVDGEARGTLPLSEPLRVAAGEVALAIRARGFVNVSRPVRVTAASLSRETVRLVSAPVPSPSPSPAQVTPEAKPPAPPIVNQPPAQPTPAPLLKPNDPTTPNPNPAPPSTRRVAVLAVGAVLGVAGLALGGGAIGTGLAARSEYAGLEQACGAAHDQCPPGFETQRDRGRGLETAAYALGAVGAAAFVTGAVVLGLELRRPMERVSVAPVLWPGGGALVAGGRF